MANDRVDIVITGGGSGGHIAPVRAVVPVVRRRSQNIRLHWIGSAEMEATAAEQLDIPFTRIPAGKLRRYLSWQNLTDIFRIKLGLIRAWLILGTLRPRLVVSTGGFVSVPVVVAAWLRRIPVITHEQTVAMGLANKINSMFACEVLLGFKEAELTVPKHARTKTRYVGNPIRAELFGGSRTGLEAWIGQSLPPDTPIVYITGGSLGAQVVNRAVEESITTITEKAFVIHQCGATEYATLLAWYDTLPDIVQKRYRIFDFIREPLRDIYASADLVVGRSGANTVTELITFDIPAVLIPLEPTSGNEQVLHAQLLVNRGQAAMIRQNEVSGDRLAQAIALELDHAKTRVRSAATSDQASERFVERIQNYVA